jgi:hypothetical protein
MTQFLDDSVVDLTTPGTSARSRRAGPHLLLLWRVQDLTAPVEDCLMSTARTGDASTAVRDSPHTLNNPLYGRNPRMCRRARLLADRGDTVHSVARYPSRDVQGATTMACSQILQPSLYRGVATNSRTKNLQCSVYKDKFQSPIGGLDRKLKS